MLRERVTKLCQKPVATHGPGFDAWKYFQFNRCSNHWALASARENIRSFDHSQEVCASLVGDIRKECYLAFATRNAYKPNPYLGPGSSLLRNVWQKTLPGKCSIVTAPDFSRDVGEGKPCTTIYRHYFDKEVERKKRALTAEEEKKFADAKKMHQANVRAVGQVSESAQDCAAIATRGGGETKWEAGDRKDPDLHAEMVECDHRTCQIFSGFG